MEIDFGITVPGGDFNDPRPGLANGKHNGRDFRKEHNAKIISPADCQRLIINSPQLNYRAVNGKYVSYWEPTIVFETPKEYLYNGEKYALYIIIAHLLTNLNLPNQFSAGTLLSYQNGLFPYHFEVQLKRGEWKNITYGEMNGWAVDPLKIAWNNITMDYASWVEFLQKHPEKSIDSFAGRPKADWDLKKDINEVLLGTIATEDDRVRIVNDGLDFKKELINALHDPRFLDWYLNEKWVKDELNRRGITLGEKKYNDLKMAINKVLATH